jgi:hypothetical protein
MSTLRTNDILTLGGLPNRGKVVQIQHNYFTTQTSTTSTAYTNLGSLNITPTRTTSQILVLMNYHMSGQGALRIVRDSTALYTPSDGFFAWTPITQTAWNSSSTRRNFSTILVDSPNKTSATTYVVQMRAYQASGAQSMGVNELTAGQNYCALVCMEIIP